jgi:hypothetical protein
VKTDERVEGVGVDTTICVDLEEDALGFLLAGFLGAGVG